MTPERLAEIAKHIAELDELKPSPVNLYHGELLFAWGVLIGLTRECSKDMNDLLTALAAAQDEFTRLDTSHAMFVKRLVEVERERDTLQQQLTEAQEQMRDDDVEHAYSLEKADRREIALQQRVEALVAALRPYSLDSNIGVPLGQHNVERVRAALHGGGTGPQ